MENSNQFNIIEKNLMEIYVEDFNIILKKFEPSCVSCSNIRNKKI